MKKLLLLPLLLISILAICQIRETKINGWNAAIYSPDVTKAFKTLVFVTGLGETGTNIKNVYKHGPGYYLQRNWRPGFNIVLLQAPNAQWQKLQPAHFTAIRSSVKTTTMHLTGLSYGAWSGMEFISRVSNHGITSAVFFSMEPDTYSAKNYPPTWFLSGKDDGGRPDAMRRLSNALNSAGINSKLTLYEGEHCCWNTYYNPAWKENGQSIYDWMMGQQPVPEQPKPEEPKPPIIDTPITNPKPNPSGPAVRRVIIPLNNDGGWWKPAHGLKPGDTVALPPVLGYGYLIGVNGTKEKPIVFIADNKAHIGGPKGKDPGFGLVLENSSHIKIIGNNKLSVGATKSTEWLGQGIGLAYTSEVEISGTAFSQCQAGIFSNAKTSKLLTGYYFHHNTFDRIDNYGVDRWNSSPIYLGSTDIPGTNSTNTGFQSGTEIAYNTFTNCSADAMQITVTIGAKIHDNVIRNYGTANADGQRTAIVLGGCTSAEVYNNTIENGFGPAVSTFGSGISKIYNNKISNVANNSIEPVIYINSKCTGGAKHQVSVYNNVLDKKYNRFIMDDSKSLIEDRGNGTGTIPTPDPDPIPEWPKEVSDKNGVVYILSENKTWKKK